MTNQRWLCSRSIATCSSLAPASVFALAGVDGAGKSSIGGAALLARNAAYFNPDLAARDPRASNLGLSCEQANGLAWETGHRGLAQALQQGTNFAFETTLGASTIPDLLLAGARQGARVQAGGHDIPEERIRARYDSSRANLIRLLPHLASLRVCDNSIEADPEAGQTPQPVLLLHIAAGRLVAHIALGHVPEWAKPILTAALACGTSHASRGTPSPSPRFLTSAHHVERRDASIKQQADPPRVFVVSPAASRSPGHPSLALAADP